MSENSVLALRKVGLDISAHVAQPLTQRLLDEAAIVLCMTESHRALINVQGRPPPRRLHLFREFIPSGEQEIGDPFGGSLRLYEATRDEMVEALPSLVERIKVLLAPGGRR